MPPETVRKTKRKAGQAFRFFLIYLFFLTGYLIEKNLLT